MKKQERATGSRFAGLAGAALALVVGCDTDKQEEKVSSVVQAQTASSPFLVLDAVSEQGVALSGSEWIEIGDRARVLDGTVPGGVSNTGTGIVRIGSDSNVGSVWAEGTVDLRDRATVAGALHVNSSGSVNQGNQVTIAGGVIAGDLGATTNIYDDPPEYAIVGGDVRLEPGNTQTVKPGHYGELVVKSNSRILLQPGDYSFSRVHIETNGEVLVPRQCAISRLRVREAFFFRGKIVQTGGDDVLRLAVAYDGTQTAHVEAPFSGAIMAPDAELILSSHHHEGRFFAKRLRVQPDAEVVGTSMVQCDTSDAADTTPLDVVPADIGPAPALAGPADVDAFLGWYYRIRKAEIAEARDALFPVTDDDDVLDVLLQRFETARTNRSFGKALMLLDLIGVMKASSAEASLISLLGQPITATALPGEECRFSRAMDPRFS